MLSRAFICMDETGIMLTRFGLGNISPGPMRSAMDRTLALVEGFVSLTVALHTYHHCLCCRLIALSMSAFAARGLIILSHSRALSLEGMISSCWRFPIAFMIDRHA